MTIPEIIAHASGLSVLIPLAVYLNHFRQQGRSGHIIGVLLFIAGVSDLLGFLMFRMQVSTAVVFNIYYTLMFLVLCRFYYEILFRHKFKIAIILGVAVFVICSALITFYVQDFMDYQNLVWITAGIIMILYSITYFINSLSTIPNVELFDNSTTWINTGVLFYFSFSLFLFSMGDYLFNKQDPQVTLLLWSTHNVNNIIKNILFAIGLSIQRQAGEERKVVSKPDSVLEEA